MERNLRQTDRRRGIIVTAIVHSLMLAAIFVFGIKYLDPPPLSGVIVAYGTDADGAGSPAYNEQTPRETPGGRCGLPNRNTRKSRKKPFPHRTNRAPSR